MPITVKYADVNGAKVRYMDNESTDTSKPPVFMIHGGGGSCDTWLYCMEALGDGFRTIAVDLPGHGFSDYVDYEGAPQGVMIKQLIAFIKQFGFEKITLLGNSYGGNLAILVYFEIKDQVENIILISSATSTIPVIERVESHKLSYSNHVAAFRSPTLETVKQRMRNLFYDGSKIPEEFCLLQLNIFSLPGMFDRWQKMNDGLMDPESAAPFEVDKRFGEIEAPMLMLWGANDKQVDIPRAERLAKEAKQTTFLTIDKAAHLPHLEQPAQVNGLICAFLNGEPV